MKESIIILITFFSLSKIGMTQFIQIPSGTNSDINSVVYINGKLFFLGHNYLSSSNDLGNTINQLNIPTNLPYNYGLNVTDTSNLYLISGYHNPYYEYEIIHSSDGGNNWTVLFDTIGATIHDLTMSENGYLLAVGNFGNVFKSQNGNNWNVSNANNITTIWKCVSLSDSNYVIGGFEYAGLSNDFGDSWNTNYFNQSHSSSIIPISLDTIYMSSYFWNGWESFFSKSIDGGNTWTSNSIGSGIGIFDMSFENATHGFAVGAMYNYPDTIGILLETTDGGNTWTTYTTNYNSEFIAVKKVNDYLFITGTNGIILKTELLVLGQKLIDFNTNLNIDIYPNPNNINTVINLSVNKPGEYTMELYDIIGNLCFIKEFNTKTTININASGIYIIKVLNNQNLQATIKRIIIEN